MSDLAELIAACDSRGIRLFPSGDGGLTVDAPNDTLTPELLARLKAHKPALLTVLRPTPSAASPLESLTVTAVTTPVVVQAVSGPGGCLALLCPSAEIAARIDAARPVLETLLLDLAVEAKAGESEPEAEPVATNWSCPRCRGFLWWEDLGGGRHCLDCEQTAFERGHRLAERASRLRTNRPRSKPASPAAPRCEPAAALDTLDVEGKRPAEATLGALAGCEDG